MLQMFSRLHHQDLSLLGIRVGVLVYLSVMFVSGTGAIRTFSLYLPFLLLIWRYLAPAGSKWLDLKQPVLIMFMLWLLLFLPSVFMAPDLGYSFKSYHHAMLRALILALLVFEGFRDPVWLSRLFQWLGWMALVLVLVFVLTVFRELTAAASTGFTNHGAFRGFGESLVLLFPMAYMATRTHRNWLKVLFWMVTISMVVLSFITGSRGVLIAVLLAFFALVLFERKKALVWILLAAVGGGLLAFSLLFDTQVVARRLEAGLGSGVRLNVIWLPVLEIWFKESFLFGFGFGPSNFDSHYYEFAIQREDLAHWAEHYGVHNQLLEIAVQAGLLGVLATVSIWVSLVYIQFKTALSAMRIGDFGGLVILASLLSHYGIRGLIDTLNWVPLGLLVGLAAALAYGLVSTTQAVNEQN